MPKVKERRRLESSRLRIKQLEGVREDIDLESFNIKVGGRTVLNLREHITDGNVERTIEGASTITVTVADPEGAILRSRHLGRTSDVKIDGLWFRLVKKTKTGNALSLTWEDREIAILRSYKKIKVVAKNVMTRAQFVRVLIKEVREVPLRLRCPDLGKGQLPPPPPPPGGGGTGGTEQEERDAARRPGFPPDTNKGRERRFADDPIEHRVEVKGRLASKRQLRVISDILETGLGMGARTKVLIVALMVGTQESSFSPSATNGVHVGVFQQDAGSGWPATRNVKKDAQAFFAAAIDLDKDDPSQEYWVLAERVQHSGEGEKYKPWFDEAAHDVDLYGVGTNAGDAANNQSAWQGQSADDKSNWMRGTTEMKNGKQVVKKENSWACIGRLADEIGYRRFMLNGTVYFISEPDLFKSRPRMVLTQDSQGVDWIDFDYDMQKLNATVTITADLHRWDAPPGSVIQLKQMGDVNGKWLVTTISRSIFKSSAKITCKKPRPIIPEQTERSWGGSTTPDPDSGGTPTGSSAQVASRILDYWEKGRYRDDNGQQLAQLKKIARGQKLLSQCGSRVEMDSRVLSFLLWLLDKGIMVGTFALVEDHKCNNGQHPKGQAVDISSLGENLRWYALNTPNPVAKRLAMDVMREARGFGAWDLICNGIGQNDRAIQALQIDNGKTRGGVWETNHIDHMHYSVAPGRREN